MAVNRFSRFSQPAQVQPVSFQDLAVAPSYMRQQEDALQQGILENTVLTNAVSNIDSELAKNFTDPIEEEFESMSHELAKNGFSQDMKNKFINLKTKLAKTQRDIIQPLEQKRAAIQKEVERLEKLYEDDPVTLQTNLNRFMRAQQSASLDPKTGKLVGTGVNTNLFMGKVLDAKQRGQILKDVMTTLKPDFEKAGLSPSAIESINTFEDLRTYADIEGVDADRIYTAIRNIGGQDLINHFKQIGFNQGIIPETPQQLAKVKSIVTQNIEKSDLTDEQKVEKIRELESIQSPQQYQNYVADQSMRDFASSSANAMAYRDVSLDRIKSKDDFALFQAKKNLEDQLKLSSINFEFPNNDIPFFLGDAAENFEIDAQGNIVYPEYDGEQVVNAGGSIKSLANYDIVDSKGKKVSNPYDAVKGIGGPAGGALQLKEGYKALRKDVYTQNEVEKKIQDIRNKVPALRNATPSEIMNKLKSFKEQLKSRESTLIFDPTKDAEPFMNSYFGKVNSQGIVELGQLAGQTNFSINNKIADTSLNGVAQGLGYDDAQQFIQAGAFSKPKFSPALGKWVVSAFNSDGEAENIYITPDNNLSQVVEPVAEAYQAHLSGEPFTKLENMTNIMKNKLGSGSNYYLFTDYNSETPQSYIISADYLADYDAAESYIKTVGDNPDNVMRMDSYMTQFTNQTLPNSNAFKQYLGE